MILTTTKISPWSRQTTTRTWWRWTETWRSPRTRPWCCGATSRRCSSAPGTPSATCWRPGRFTPPLSLSLFLSSLLLLFLPRRRRLLLAKVQSAAQISQAHLGFCLGIYCISLDWNEPNAGSAELKLSRPIREPQWVMLMVARQCQFGGFYDGLINIRIFILLWNQIYLNTTFSSMKMAVGYVP